MVKWEVSRALPPPPPRAPQLWVLGVRHGAGYGPAGVSTGTGMRMR